MAALDKASSVPVTTPVPPVRQYSFTDWQVSNPTAPPPGDRMDAEYDRANASIAQVINWVEANVGLTTPPSTPGNFDSDAAGSAALAQDYADVTMAWAEHMPDTIPPNILAVMGVTGDHWSSRWWANQAVNIARNAGAFSGEAPPANPYPGQFWFDSANPQLYVWYVDPTSSQWVIATAYAGGLTTDAPSDGQLYGRQNGAWHALTGGSGGVITVSDTAPAAVAGSMWFDSVGLQLYIAYYDGTSMQWVATNNQSSGGAMYGITKNDRSGAITLANTAQQLMAANTARRGWSLQNKSTANMWFNDLGGTADPAANSSTYLPPGAYYESEPLGASITSVSILGDATAAQFVAKEW